MDSLLSKRVVIFAAYGAISSEVARQAAKAGAHVFLSGRDRVQIEALANSIREKGGRADTDMVDAMESEAVAPYLQTIARDGGIDAVFNGIGLRAEAGAYGTPAPSLSVEKFLLPLQVHAGSTHLTSALAGQLMSRQGGGSIVTLSASLSGAAVPFMAGITAACGAIEALTRSLAGEFGRTGLRVNCVRATAMPATRTIQETNARYYETLGVPVPSESPAENLLRRHITVADTAGAVVFLMSDGASGITGQVLNVCGGTLLD